MNCLLFIIVLFCPLVKGQDITYAIFTYNMSNIFLGSKWELINQAEDMILITDLGLDFQNYAAQYVHRPPDIFHFAF